MPAPVIYGDPKIRSTDTGSVFLEVVVTGADPSKTKWMLNDKELEQNECYVFGHTDEGGNRNKLTCEIKVLALVSETAPPSTTRFIFLFFGKAVPYQGNSN
ncbi:hypothetical protein RB195_023488 [Necator americanus]|uniref:Immunoglobulin I-set domain protein n=1 Tax=Necator americanus TaxID=51031 RepID=A0ABR1EJY6_NECAM